MECREGCTRQPKKRKKKDTIKTVKDSFETIFKDKLVDEKTLRDFVGKIAIVNSGEFNRRGIILPPDYEYTVTKDKEDHLIFLVLKGGKGE